MRSRFQALAAEKKQFKDALVEAVSSIDTLKQSGTSLQQQLQQLQTQFATNQSEAATASAAAAAAATQQQQVELEMARLQAAQAEADAAHAAQLHQAKQEAVVRRAHTRSAGLLSRQGGCIVRCDGIASVEAPMRGVSHIACVVALLEWE